MGEHGRGWLSEPDAKGRYRIAVTMADGRRVWRRAKNKRDAARVQRELIAAREADLDPSSRTLAEWLRSWLTSLRDAKHQRIRPGTLRHYTNVVEGHIIPALGSRRLGSLSERHVQAWVDGDASAPRTVSHHRAVLRRALNVAVRQRVVSRNVALAVDLPELKGFQGNPLTFAEARALLTATGSDRLAPLYRLALDSGCRQAELLGLGWDDFDETTGTITVTAQLVRIRSRKDAKGKVTPGGWGRAATKSARATPTMLLMPATVAALAAHKRKMAAERTADWTHAGHIFTTSTGKPYHGAEVLKAFKAACRKAGIAERRFHDLRASCATLMRELGVPEEVRMSRLGHSTKAMAQHYAQVRDGYDREAIDAFAKALAG